MESSNPGPLAGALGVKQVLKSIFRVFFLILAFPLAALSLFGRLKSPYLFGAQTCALMPAMPGNYLRTAYYRLTLAGFDPSSRIEFGSYFAHASAKAGPNVYIGSYCILGCTHIGPRT